MLGHKTSHCDQCDQMARLLFKHLTIYNVENLPNSIRNLPKYLQKFDEYIMNPLKFNQVI